MASEPFTILLTGLPGSGKSSLSVLVAEGLRQLGRTVQILDGEQIRATLSRDLGFDRDGRRTQAERLAFLAALLNANRVDAVIAAVTPYADDRSLVAETIGQFGEVAVVCPADVCRSRDTEELYERADAGRLERFTGVSDPYEAPTSPMMSIHTDACTPDQGAYILLKGLEAAGWIQGVDALDLSAAYSSGEDEAVMKHLQDLGYL